MKTYTSLPNFASVPHAGAHKLILLYWLNILEVKFEQEPLNTSWKYISLNVLNLEAGPDAGKMSTKAWQDFETRLI